MIFDGFLGHSKETARKESKEAQAPNHIAPADLFTPEYTARLETTLERLGIGHPRISKIP